MENPVIKPRPRKISIWKILTLVFLLLFITALFSKGFTAFSPSSPKQTAEKTLLFINTNLMQPGLQATLLDVKEEKGLYKATIELQGTPLEIYITKDGTLFFTQPIDTTKTLPSTPATPEVVDASPDDDPLKGSEDAPVTIIEFSDFQCPLCEGFYTETLPQIEEAYIKTGKVKFIYRDFPLRNTHSYAQKAAEAAECADDQGKFWEYHNMLFENQDALKITDLKKYAADLELDTEKFNTCLDSGEKEEEVNADLKDGESYRVGGTPTFFINGQVLEGAYPFEIFQNIIEQELSKTEEN